MIQEEFKDILPSPVSKKREKTRQRKRHINEEAISKRHMNEEAISLVKTDDEFSNFNYASKEDQIPASPKAKNLK